MSKTIENTSRSRFLSSRLKFTKADERAQMISLAKEFHPEITLGRGDPDLPTPQHIVDAGIRALQEGQTHYTDWTGLPELRRQIANKLRRDNGIPINSENDVIVTVGAQEAIFLLMQSLLNPGDEVILPEPRYTPYDTAITAAGGKIVSIPTTAENSFQLDVDVLESMMNERTKILILINPNNPTGTVYDNRTLVDIAELAKRKDIVVVSDEIYEKFNYGDIPHLSIASLPGMYERTLTVNGFSKTYAMTGWRVGYIAGPSELMRPMAQIKYAMTISTPTVSQYAALAAVTGSQDCVQEHLNKYAKRRKIMMDGLNRIGIPYNEPRGAFYVFADVRAYGMSSFEFARNVLAEASVLVFPGTAFGPSGEGYIRISLLTAAEHIEEATHRLEKVIANR